MADKNSADKKKKALNSYARYSGITLQMAGMVLLGAWGGRKIDHFFSNNFPLFTVLLILAGAFGALWYLFRSLLK